MRILDSKDRHRGGSAFARGAAATIAAAFIVLGAAVAALSGCSLALDTRAVQCRSDQDCAKFSGSACDVATRICQPVLSGGGKGGQEQVNGGGGTGAANGGTAGLGGGGGAAGPRCRVANGCLPCSATQLDPFANSCTDAACVPFDNRARLLNQAADGGLKPLPGT